MSRIPTHTLNSAPIATRTILESLAQRSPTPGVPINLHAQMAHSPAVLVGYMAMRKALDDLGTLDRKVRTAILLTVAAADECVYTLAINSMLAGQTGWNPQEVMALREGTSHEPKLSALLSVVHKAARNHGTVNDDAWQSALDVGWSAEELAETFGFIGLTQYVDSFLNYAGTELDASLQSIAVGAAR